MAKLVQISAAATAINGAFFRLGLKWTTEGTVVDTSDFTADEWKILTTDKMLHIGPAPDGSVAVAQEDATLRDALKATFGEMEAADFEANGKPKLGAVKERLPAQAKHITAKLVADVWAELNPAP
jgi:hypothetical protein